MTKTYITTMPNHIGAFMLASRCLSEIGVNIKRVSYNKAVDSHTLFIDAEGTETQLEEADRKLKEIGYLHKPSAESGIILLEFKLLDVPGSVTPVLELIADYNLNISYISSQNNGTEYQYFKMGLRTDDRAMFDDFINRARGLCEVRVIDYNRSEKSFDNSIFYSSFVSSLIEDAGLPQSCREELLVNANLAMQTLDEQGLLPYRTFDTISKFARMLSGCRGEAFSPRITAHKVTENTFITVIEPPCGSNTIIIKSGDEYLFVDTGYAYYKEEMLGIIRELIPEWDLVNKRVLLTHADVDHVGLLPLFDEIITSDKSAESLCLSYEGKDDLREQNPLHKPYVRICKTLTGYEAPDPQKVNPMFSSKSGSPTVLKQVGCLDFGDLSFEVYEGGGGHLSGELILIDYEHRIVFSGDVYVNVKGMTSEQKQYNMYAPILMNSVDTDKILCAKERKAIFDRLGAGKWRVFGAHGAVKDYDTATTG